MGRPQLKAGEIGKITAKKLPGVRKYRARARLRTLNDEIVQVEGVAGTVEQAKANLRANAKRRAFAGVGTIVTTDTTLGELVDLTLTHLRGLPPSEMRPQTVEQYEAAAPLMDGSRAADGYPAISGMRLGDIDKPAPIHAWLRAISEVSLSNGKRAKSLLSHAFTFATRNGISPWGAVNPAKHAELARPDKKPVKAPSVAEINAAREAVAKWQDGWKRTDLVSIMEVIAATGARPNEVLALRWQDVDLGASPATVEINGTLVELNGKASEGGGIQRQDMPKSAAGFRTLSLPSWATTRLMEMRVLSTSEKLFPNGQGNWLSRRHVSGRFRDAVKGTSVEGMTLYSYRRGVATVIERTLGADAAARQLGHDSTSVTKEHYIERATDAGDFRVALDKLAPQ